MNKRRMETNQRPEGQVDKFNLHTSNEELEKQVIINKALVNELKANEKIIQDLRSDLTQLKEEHQDQTGQEKEALLKQVEELKAQKQTSSLEKKVKQLTAELEKQVEDNKMLWKMMSSMQKRSSDETQAEKDLHQALQQKYEELEENTAAERKQRKSKVTEHISANEELEKQLFAEQEISQVLRALLTQLREEKEAQDLAAEQQVEELKAQLQRAETLHHSQEEKMKQLTAKLERQTASVSGVRDERQDVLRETWTNISQTVTDVDVLLPQPEPKTRAEFLRYSREITLDPNTAHKELLLSEGNRRVTEMGQSQYYPRHPDRFTGFPQVLSRESLTGRCYWEVEWSGRGAAVAVSYKSIRRDGGSNECWFGFNNKSQILHCNPKSYTFIYNGINTDVSGPPSSRIGVYLDHSAGILSYYSVAKTMTLLHRVQTTFTEPLHAGLWLYCGASAEFCKLK